MRGNDKNRRSFDELPRFNIFKRHNTSSAITELGDR
jgi:hypothetical protein